MYNLWKNLQISPEVLFLLPKLPNFIAFDPLTDWVSGFSQGSSRSDRFTNSQKCYPEELSHAPSVALVLEVASCNFVRERIR